MGYTFAFSWQGLAVFALAMVPNLLYFLQPQMQVPGSGAVPRRWLAVLEHGSQAAFIALLVLLVSEQPIQTVNGYSIGMAAALLMYYVFWAVYFAGRGRVQLSVLLGLALLPVAYFALAALWLHNYPALLPITIFGIAHTAMTWLDYRATRQV